MGIGTRHDARWVHRHAMGNTPVVVLERRTHAEIGWFDFVRDTDNFPLFSRIVSRPSFTPDRWMQGVRPV